VNHSESVWADFWEARNFECVLSDKFAVVSVVEATASRVAASVVTGRFLAVAETATTDCFFDGAAPNFEIGQIVWAKAPGVSWLRTTQCHSRDEINAACHVGRFHRANSTQICEKRN